MLNRMMILDDAACDLGYCAARREMFHFLFQLNLNYITGLAKMMETPQRIAQYNSLATQTMFLEMNKESIGERLVITTFIRCRSV